MAVAGRQAEAVDPLHQTWENASEKHQEAPVLFAILALPGPFVPFCLQEMSPEAFPRRTRADGEGQRGL